MCFKAKPLSFGCHVRAQVKHRWSECRFRLCKIFIFIYFCQSLQPDQSNNMSADLPNGFPPYTPVKKPARCLELASFHRWERWPLLWRHSNPVDHCHLVLVPPVFHDADSEWIFAGCSCLCVCVKVTLPPHCLLMLLPAFLCDLWLQSKPSSDRMCSFKSLVKALPASSASSTNMLLRHSV